MAYDKLAAKWEHYFERNEDEEEPAAGRGGAPAAKMGRPSLFQKLCMRPSFTGAKPAGKVRAAGASWDRTEGCVPQALDPGLDIFRPQSIPHASREQACLLIRESVPKKF